MVDKIKKLYFKIFIVFAILSVMYIITQILKNFFGTDVSAFIAFWIVAISVTKIQDNFKKMQQEEINMIKDLYALNYLTLSNIKKITISDNGKGLVLLKNNSIRTIEQKTIPRTQEQLDFLDKQYGNL